MLKNLIACLAAACAALATANPARADDQASKTASGHASVHWATVPVYAVGFVCGALVGTPICFARRFYEQEIDGIRGMVGETDNKLLTIPAGVFWLPMAALASGGEAPVFAVRNSWMAGEPFSKEQFSLGEDGWEPAPMEKPAQDR